MSVHQREKELQSRKQEALQGLPHNFSALYESISALKNDMIHKGPPACILDFEGRVIYANPAFEGFADAFLEANLIDNALSPQYSAEEVEAILLAGGPNPNEYIIEQEGKTHHFLASYHSVEGAQAMAVLLRPNDEVEEVRHSLSLAHERMSDMFRLVADWTWETDRDGRLTHSSQNVQRILGYHPEELVGQLMTLLQAEGRFTKSDSPKEKNKGTDSDHCIKALILGPHPQPFRDKPVFIKNRDGKERLLQVSGLPYYDHNTGAFAGFRGSARDITEQHQANKALAKAKESAELANRAKSEFLANMSHELRTPLNAVIGFSEIMSSQLLGPLGNTQYHEYSHDIYDSAKHLLSVINDILDVAKIEAGKLDLLEDELDPLDLAVSVQRLMVERAENNSLKLKLSLPAKLPYLYADARKLKQILINLLGNAVKFTPAGGIVELAGGINDKGDFQFIVMDTGIGIEKGDLKRCFEAFSQIDSKLSRQFDGTGLGLPLARGLARLHGGDLTLSSTPGKGTTATLTIPAKRVVR